MVSVALLLNVVYVVYVVFGAGKPEQKKVKHKILSQYWEGGSSGSKPPFRSQR